MPSTVFRSAICAGTSALLFAALGAGGCQASGPTPAGAQTAPAETGRGVPPSAATAPEGEATEVRGWYRVDRGRGRLQLCGSEETLTIESTQRLQPAARARRLDTGMPVYVQLRGTRQDDRLQVAEVLQMGSPEPVRDCPMTGVATPVD